MCCRRDQVTTHRSMSSSYRTVTPLGYVDEQLPDLIPHQSWDVGNDFSFLELDSVDLAAVYLDPFEHPQVDSQPVTFDDTLQHSQYHSQEPILTADFMTQLSDLTVSNTQLQQRIDELNGLCVKFEDKNVSTRQ